MMELWRAACVWKRCPSDALQFGDPDSSRQTQMFDLWLFFIHVDKWSHDQGPTRKCNR